MRLLLHAVLFILAAAVPAAAADVVRNNTAPPQRQAVQPLKQSLTLIMVDEPSCHYCRRWNKEVGGGYGRSKEGRIAPLQRVRRESSVLNGFAPVIYTPTFILARDGNELGRITGYPGQLFFWEELSQLMSSAGVDPKG